MNNAMVRAATAGVSIGAATESSSSTEVTLEQLSQAVGENALLNAEFDRKLAGRLLETREELRVTKADLESLRWQMENFAQGLTQFQQILRYEWLRKVQAGGATQAAAAGTSVAPRLIHPEKLLSMGADLRLNIGCGPKPLPNYLNVDERELGGVDLVADVRTLPFTPESVSGIHAAHLVEHFTPAELKSKVLPAWRELLKPGGLFRVVVPDAEGMIQEFSRGNCAFESLREVTFGSQDYPGNYHYTMFSRESLQALLRESGFLVAEYTAVGRANGLCLEMEITAVRAS
jgi:predicted SAM-dependent methyltransferase